MKIIYKIHPKTILVLKSKVMKLKTERDLPVHMCFRDLYVSLMIFTPSPGNLVAWEEQDRWMARGRRDGKAVLVCEHMTSPQSVPSPPEPRQCVECITIERGALFQMSITQAPRPPWLPLKVWEPGEFLCCLNIKPGLRLILLKK